MRKRPFIGSLAIGIVALVIGFSLPTTASKRLSPAGSESISQSSDAQTNQSSSKAIETTHPHDHWGNKSEFWLVVVTGILVLATSILAAYTFKLWSSTSELVNDAKESSKKELRAYVGVVGIEVIRTMENKILGWVDFENTGQTPAHDLTSWICEGVFDKKSPSESSFKKGDDEGKGGVLVPGAKWRRHVLIGLHNLNMSDLESESDAIWVWGGIDYRDSFGEPCNVSFRFWVGRKRMRRDPIGQPEEWWPLIPHKYGNKATYGDKTQT